MVKAIRKEITIVLVVFLVGMVVGWFLLGWVIAPVQWTNGAPIDLQKSYRDFHLRILSTALSSKAVSLEDAQKLGLGVGVSDSRWTIDQVLTDLNELAKDPQTGLRYRPLIDTLEALKAQEATGQTGATGVTATPTNLFPILLVLLVVAVVGFVSIQVVRRVSPSARQQAVSGPTAISRVRAGERPAAVWEGESEAPLRQFDLTYVLGDDHFDMSNAIETPDGQFLGECGMGISERIGVGNPDKVSALEVWVFDKNDIRTVTSVLMSESAYNDRTTRDKLAAKGTPELAEEGAVINLETATLRVRARVVELEYGSGGLPPNSFFQKLHVTMAAWQVGDGGVTQPAPIVE
jgi:hypothetical protein